MNNHHNNWQSTTNDLDGGKHHQQPPNPPFADDHAPASPSQVNKKKSLFLQPKSSDHKSGGTNLDQKQEVDGESYYTEEEEGAGDSYEDEFNQVEHLVQSNDQDGLRNMGALRVRATMKELKA